MKVLILSASPRRDKYIDELLQHELQQRGYEVWVRPCLREGRTAVLEVEPNVVVVPPVRNPYSRDFVETCKNFGIGVVVRHTEPSCDKADFERMDQSQKADIYGKFPYNVDAEVVWGEFEAQELNKRGVPFKTTAVGAIVADLYKSEFLKEKVMSKEVLCQKHRLDISKPIVLAASPWGFIDSAPDLQTDHLQGVSKDAQGRDQYIAMLKELYDGLSATHNILVTLHPGVDEGYYRSQIQGVPIDTETAGFDLLHNADCLIHGGSTMAIEMHILGKPAFQFSDVNGCGWWQDGESVISQVSPRVRSAKELVDAVQMAEKKSNAFPHSLEKLEKGRYGSLDGGAIKKIADVVCQVSGEFHTYWPRTHRKYDQLMVRTFNDVVQEARCNVCKDTFTIARPEFVAAIAKATGTTEQALMGNTFCPICGARFFREVR